MPFPYAPLALVAAAYRAAGAEVVNLEPAAGDRREAGEEKAGGVFVTGLEAERESPGRPVAETPHG